MRLPKRAKPPHDTPQWVPEGSFFFITVNCVPPGTNQMVHPKLGRATLDAAAYYHEHLIWHCRLMLLMPDHLHGIIAFPSEPGMKANMRNWKRFLATQYGVNWQRDFFDHRLRNRHAEDEKIHYILMNPVRRGLCERMEDWPWVYRPNDRPPPLLNG